MGIEKMRELRSAEHQPIEPIEQAASRAEDRQQVKRIRAVIAPAIPFHRHATIEVEPAGLDLRDEGMVRARINHVYLVSELTDPITQYIACAERAHAVIHDPD